MAATYAIEDLERWDERIREKVEEFGLSCFPQEFEICDHYEMLGYMAYHGMPAHYPHWSYGKSYEKLKTMYDHGVSGLPYEMVINSDPCLAYLMRDNSLCLQVLTIAHVYGHNDFFKNNFTFHHTRPEETLGRFKVRADRVRTYVEDPSIGYDRVEHILDAAHALSLQCRRNLAVRKLSHEEQRERAIEAAQPKEGPYADLRKREAYVEPDLRKVPLEPEEDILLFIRDHNPYLGDWERDLLTIVHEEAQYFIPQIETKIMNEGWACTWHREILNSLDLPQDVYMEFLVRHNQVVARHPGGVNPYHLGLAVWDDIRRRCEENGEDWKQKLFEIREVERDVSFLRRFLTEELMRELDLFEYAPRGNKLVVTKVADEDSWREVKNTLLRQIGMGSTPVIKVVDADYGGNRTLFLRHFHDGRDLQLGYAEKTLGYLHQLWGRRVVLETVMQGKRTLLSYGEQGFDAKLLR
jgi:stage V sporulation protein R